MWREAWIVCRKEWIDSVRDRRAVLAATVYVVVGPLVAGLALSAAARNVERGPAQLNPAQVHAGSARGGAVDSRASGEPGRRIDGSQPVSGVGPALATLPIFLLMAAFVASMSVAIDVTAGERERGSLEPLLLHPVSRHALATGKWLATVLFSGWGMLVALTAIQVVLRTDRLQRLHLPIDFTGAGLPPLLALLLPLALFAPAAQKLAAIGARTAREAHTWLSMIMFVPMVPGFLFAFGVLAPADWMRPMPILGHHVLVSELVRGDVPGAGITIALAVVTTIAAAACVAMAGVGLQRERLVVGR